MSDYFSHDYHARNDGKLVKIAMKHGMEGIGIFWCIVEMLYEEGGEIKVSECDRIAFESRVKKELVTEIIKNPELFKIVGEVFFSESVSHRIFMRTEKSERARLSASARWENNDDANAKRTQSERNAKKGKEKEKKSKVKESFPPDSNEVKFSVLLFDLIKQNNKTHRFNNFSETEIENQVREFSEVVDLMLRNEKRDPHFTEFLLQWCQQNSFWRANILSMKKFREQFDTMAAQAQRDYLKTKEEADKNKIL